MCDCRTFINKMIAQYNSVLSENLIAVEKLNKRSRKNPVRVVTPTFCPFCAERWEDETSNKAD